MTGNEDHIQERPDGEDRLRADLPEDRGERTSPEDADSSPPPFWNQLVHTNPSKEELEAFFGTNAEYYLNRWRAMQEREGSGASFNWPAFLFSGLWLPYRKLYWHALVLYGILLVEGVAEVLAQVFLKAPQEAVLLMGWCVSIPAWFIVGFWGNAWYFAHARRIIADARTYEMPEDEHFEYLSQRGGTNLLSAFGIFAVFFTILYFLNALVENL